MSDATNITGIPPAPPPAAPAAPPKPAPPPAKVPAKPTGKERRGFLWALFGSWFAIGMTALTASTIGMVLGTLRFLFPNVLSEPPNKVKVGTPDLYEEGKVEERFKDQNI